MPNSGSATANLVEGLTGRLTGVDPLRDVLARYTAARIVAAATAWSSSRQSGQNDDGFTADVRRELALMLAQADDDEPKFKYTGSCVYLAGTLLGEWDGTNFVPSKALLEMPPEMHRKAAAFVKYVRDPTKGL